MNKRETFDLGNVDIEIRFGWDAYPRQRSGGLISGLVDNGVVSVDCDGSVIFCRKDGNPISDDICECCDYYQNLSMFNSAVVHGGDNKTGELYDDEKISVKLSDLPLNVDSMVITMDTFKCKAMPSGKIQNTFIRVTSVDGGDELCRCEFGNLGRNDKPIVVAKVYKADDTWLFEEIGKQSNTTSMTDFITSLTNIEVSI
jgi:hypothetical protein